MTTRGVKVSLQLNSQNRLDTSFNIDFRLVHKEENSNEQENIQSHNTYCLQYIIL